MSHTYYDSHIQSKYYSIPKNRDRLNSLLNQDGTAHALKYQLSITTFIQ